MAGRSPNPYVFSLLIVIVLALSIWYALANQNVEVLFLGTFASAILLWIMMRGSEPGRWSRTQVMIRCRSCQGLSAEGNKFCGHCGREI